jgi:hypothetical protein
MRGLPDLFLGKRRRSDAGQPGQAGDQAESRRDAEHPQHRPLRREDQQTGDDRDGTGTQVTTRGT